MEFKLNLIAENPYKGELVLEPETPLEGMNFISAVSCCLRRSIEHVSRARHNTLGGLATYEITVPQQVAYDSGYYDSTNEFTVIVERNLLSNFIFYVANVTYGANGRPCFPYMQNEAVLTSLIDEFAFLEAWVNTGYANRLMMQNGKVVANNGYFCGTNVGNSNTGIGCGGCTVNVGTGQIALRPITDGVINGSGGMNPDGSTNTGNNNNSGNCSCGTATPSNPGGCCNGGNGNIHPWRPPVMPPPPPPPHHHHKHECECTPPKKTPGRPSTPFIA